jgi:hypothetical protein
MNPESYPIRNVIVGTAGFQCKVNQVQAQVVALAWDRMYTLNVSCGDFTLRVVPSWG